jgi:ankyrin repeat protein
MNVGIESGLNPNIANDNGFSPLLFSVRYGHVKDAKMLLSMGADINSHENDGWTALMFAIDGEFAEV